jgi:ketosteroid isomerase-like protein
MTDFSDLPPDDQQAIKETLLTMLASFRNRDAVALHAVYSDDADWVNAFGTVKRGREVIVGYLTGLFDATTSTAATRGPARDQLPDADTRGRSGVCTPAYQRSGRGRRRHT